MILLGKSVLLGGVGHGGRRLHSVLVKRSKSADEFKTIICINGSDSIGGLFLETLDVFW